MKPLELQDILLEADKIKITADPEKMNQSKMERRRVTDYTEDEDDTVEVNAQDDNDNMDEILTTTLRFAQDDIVWGRMTTTRPYKSRSPKPA